MGLGTHFAQFVGGSRRQGHTRRTIDDTEAALTAAQRSGTTTTFNWCHATNSAGHNEASLSAAAESGARYIFGYGRPIALCYYGSHRAHPRLMDSFVQKHGARVNDRVGISAALRGPDLSSIEITRRESNAPEPSAFPSACTLGRATLARRK